MSSWNSSGNHLTLRPGATQLRLNGDIFVWHLVPFVKPYLRA
jgi:hypothetical protein